MRIPVAYSCFPAPECGAARVLTCGYGRRVQATLTVLFTDAVASTQALARLGDERFGVVQRAHLELLRTAVAAHEGREVKSLGDGLMVTFGGAADALACAVAMQQAVEASARRGDDGLPLRVGVALGDVDVAGDGDCHGTAVVEAARVCAAAGRRAGVGDGDRSSGSRLAWGTCVHAAGAGGARGGSRSRCRWSRSGGHRWPKAALSRRCRCRRGSHLSRRGRSWVAQSRLSGSTALLGRGPRRGAAGRAARW